MNKDLPLSLINERQITWQRWHLPPKNTTYFWPRAPPTLLLSISENGSKNSATPFESVYSKSLLVFHFHLDPSMLKSFYFASSSEIICYKKPPIIHSANIYSFFSRNGPHLQVAAPSNLLDWILHILSPHFPPTYIIQSNILLFVKIIFEGISKDIYCCQGMFGYPLTACVVCVTLSWITYV